MIIVCPACKAKYSFDEQKISADGIKLRCSKCRAMFRVARKEPLPSGEATPTTALSSGKARIKVVVANESAAFCSAITKVLAAEPFDVFSYNDGREAMTAIENLRPDVVLLDVALPSMYGFEICEAVRKDPSTASIKLILIASIYDKTRYKRSPTSLYGADDYIEKHHIPDSLTTMIYRLVSGQAPVEAPVGKKAQAEEIEQAAPQHLSAEEMADQEATRQELKQDEERETTLSALPSAPELPEAHVKARRFARIIVSDIVLYNQAKVDEGVKRGNFYTLLADDIHEGRSLYERRVPDEVRRETSYLEEAFEELITTKKREFNLC